jgi:multimeric flavodoxin WrbA
VAFQSGKGHTWVLAEAVHKGVGQAAEVSGQIFEFSGKDVHESRFRNPGLMEALDSSDRIVLGCATYKGSASSIFKTVLEAAFNPHWLEQRWKDRVAAGFTNSASQNGDKTFDPAAAYSVCHVDGHDLGRGERFAGNNWSGGSHSDLNRVGTWIGAVGSK